jgi:hypothetical protein
MRPNVEGKNLIVDPTRCVIAFDLTSAFERVEGRPGDSCPVKHSVSL